MTKFDELKERFPNLIPVQELRSNISIVELAIQYGYEPQRHKGQSRPVLEHPAYNDTIIIKNPRDASQQVYQRAGDFTDSGTIIDFVRNRLSTVFSTFNRPGEHEFKNITSVLYDYLRIDPNHVNQNRKLTAAIPPEAGPKQQFAKDQFDIRALEKDNYLTKRQIAPETIKRPEFTTKVFAQIAYFNPTTGHTDNFLTVKENPDRKYLQFTNVAFPYYNGLSSELTGMELRNENIKLHAAGSDRNGSVFISNTPPKTAKFHIMESAIDALSHQQLRSIGGDDKFDSVYFSTGGQLTAQQINTIGRYVGSFQKEDNWTINLSFDNDTKGSRYDLQFIQQMAATKFPLSPSVGGLNRVSYLLPQEDIYRPLTDLFMERIELYNKNVQGQFARLETDPLGQKEYADQLITIGRNTHQVQISIPEAQAPLSAVSRLLLEVSGLNQRIKLDKACGKDFNEDLVREIQNGERFRYSLVDEAGHEIYNSNSPSVVARTLNQLRQQGESEGSTKVYVVQERQSFGFRQPQAELKIVEGKLVTMTQQPEFQRQLQAEKTQRNQPDQSGEKKALNPETKPQLGQLPQQHPEDGSSTRLRR